MVGKPDGEAISEAYNVCNYPSRNNVGGFQLAQDMLTRVEDLGGEIKQEEVTEIINGKELIVKTNKE